MTQPRLWRAVPLRGRGTLAINKANTERGAVT
jgi:hypothetical protein